MKVLSAPALALAVALINGVSLAEAPSPAARNQLAPTGTLRVGVVFAPAPTALFVTLDSTNQPHGVTVDLGRELAKAAEVSVEFKVAPNSGDLTDWLGSGAIDVTFLPVDEERRKRVDFGPEYFIFESTYLIRPGVDIRTLADVDRSGIRVVGITNTATIRAAGSSLKTATITAVSSVEEAVAMLRSRKADALALGRDALPTLAAQMPGSTILNESYLRGSVAVALPKGRSSALAYVATFIENAKASGLIRRAFDDAGLKQLAVAPPSPRR